MEVLDEEEEPRIQVVAKIVSSSFSVFCSLDCHFVAVLLVADSKACWR